MVLRRLQRYLLEPVNALTHLAGAILAAAGLAWLILLSRNEPGKMASLAVYGVTLLALFVTSTLFHGIKLPERRRMWLNRLDHVAIFALIAGTYTPIAYNLFPQGWRWQFLAIVWLIALTGAAYKLFSSRIHGLFNVSVYPALGWAGVLPALIAGGGGSEWAPLQGMWLLLLGGLFFMIGFMIYYRKRPDPWPGVFGHHEIWHLCVLGGSACHFLFMLYYVIPAR
jgi:hemolysin III